MKVNFTLWGTDKTGGTRVIFEVAARLAKKGHKVIITSIGSPKHYWFPLNKVKVIYPELKYSIRIPHKGRVSINTLGNWLLRKVKAPYNVDPTRLLALSIPADVDVNVATLCFTAYVVYRSAKGCPFYYIQHYEPLFFASDPYISRMAKEACYLPLNWIVNSSWANAKLRDEVGREGPVVLPGVDTSVFFPRKVERSEDNKIIIALGKGNKIKGLGYLFEALNIICKKSNLKLRLILYGNEPYLANHSPIPTDYIVRPSDEELAKLYSIADVAVVPSLYESSPLPPLEAMACGTPVVTTRYGTEDYCFHEVNSLVVPPEEPKKMAEAILRILTDESLREKFREEGLKTARQFTWNKTLNEVERLFEKVLRGSHNGQEDHFFSKRN